MSASCATLRVARRGHTLELHCVPSPARDDGDCLVVPTYAQHYAYAARLLGSVQRFAVRDVTPR